MEKSDGERVEFNITAYLIKNENVTNALWKDLNEARAKMMNEESVADIPDCIFGEMKMFLKIRKHHWKSMDPRRPETIVDLLWSAMGCVRAHRLLTGFFAHQNPEFVARKDYSEPAVDLSEMSRMDGECKMSKRAILNALGSLSSEELVRVKAFLKWNVFSNLKGMRFGAIEKMSYLDLAHAIQSQYAVHATSVLHRILVQIGRRDLAEDVASGRMR